MKTKIILSLISFLFITGMYGQKSLIHIPGTPCENCKWENPNEQANQTSKILNGNAIIATSYTQTACGLNFVQASNPLYKRGFSFAVGVTQPAGFAISGIPAGAVIQKAFLFVGASGNLGTYSATIVNPLSVSGNFSMTQIGQDVDKCWGYSGTYNYRGDVTSIIAGNGNYVISGIPVMPQTPNKDADGATLFIIYTDASQFYTGSIVIADGAQVGVGSAVNSVISGFNVCGNPTLTTNFLIVSDLQKIGNADIRLNSLTNNFLLATASQQVWNYVTAPVAPVTAAQTTANFGVTTTGDCFDVIMAGMYFQTSCQVCGVLSIPNQTICAGVNASFSVPNNSLLTSPSYSVNPGGLTNTTGNFNVSPLVTTTYTTYVTGQNASSTTATETQTFMITVNAQPNVAPTTTQSSCTNSVNAINLGLTFTPTTPVPNYTVNWSPTPAGIISPTQTSVSGGIAPGVYSATVIATGGCSTTTSFTINPTPTIPVFSLVPNASSYTVTCAQPTVPISVSPASYTYSWTNGFSAVQTGTTANFSNSNMGTWSVTAVDPLSGCVATQTFVVSQNTLTPSATLTPVSQNITCAVGSITTLTVVGNPTVNIQHQFMTSFGGTLTVGTPTALFVPGGPCTGTCVTINSVNGCSVSTTFSVTSSAGFPLFNISSPQQFTIGCGTTSLTSISISTPTTFPTPGGPVSYTVLPPSYSFTAYSLGGSPVYTVNTPGTYTVIVHDNTNNCETKVPVSIISNTFAPQLSAAADQQTLTCYVPKTLLHGTSTNTNVSYSWAFPGIPGTTPNDTLTVFINSNTSANGTLIATYTLSVTDNINKCKSTQTLSIYQNISPPTPIITPAATVAITCSTPSISLTNSSTATTATLFPHTLIISADWGGPSPQVSYSNVTSYNAYTPGTYTMFVTDLNNGCKTFTTKTVVDNRVYPNLSDATYTFDCGTNGAVIYPVITGPSAGFTYSWSSLGSVTSASFSSYTNPTITVNLSGDYVVSVTNPLNGCSNVAVIRVVNGSLNGDISPSTLTGFAPLTVNFTNNSASSSTVTGTSSITTVWSFGNGTYQTTNSASISPTTVYQQPGTYTVVAYINKGSCQDTVTKIINVELPSSLDVPNVFTPNGDGANDLFFLKVANLTEIKALIYDRWGNKVFETNSSTGNIEWDGKTQAGKEASAGTYFYVITGMGKDGVEYSKKGNVSLYR